MPTLVQLATMNWEMFQVGWLKSLFFIPRLRTCNAGIPSHVVSNIVSSRTWFLLPATAVWRLCFYWCLSIILSRGQVHHMHQGLGHMILGTSLEKVRLLYPVPLEYPILYYWNLVLATETHTVGKRAVYILLECFVVKSSNRVKTVYNIITARKRSMFTPVCHSVHRGFLVPGWGAWSGGVLSRGVPDGDPSGRLLLRAVRILLECILVLDLISNTHLFI